MPGFFRQLAPVVAMETCGGSPYWGREFRKLGHVVPVKSEETQGAAMVFRVREFLIPQRTQAINALRGHLAERLAWKASPDEFVERPCSF